MAAITITPPTFIKVTTYKHNDPGEHLLVCGIDLDNSAGVAKCYKYDRTMAFKQEWIFDEFGKADSVSGVVYDNGTLRVIVSQADAPGASGSTSAGRLYEVPGAFPPAQAASTNTTDTFIRNQFKAFLIGLRDLANKFITAV